MSNEGLKVLHKLLREAISAAQLKTLSFREIELFCEVESVLYLYETIEPNPEKHDAKHAWALVSGYAINGLNAEESARQKCLRVRGNLRYLRTASGWSWWLDWYRRQAEAIRFFRFEQPGSAVADALRFSAKLYDVPARAERISVYETFQTHLAIGSSRKFRPYAPGGSFHFDVEGVGYTVQITEAMAKVAEQTPPKRVLPSRSHHPLITVTWDDLIHAARDIDTIEAASAFLSRGDWANRLNGLRLMSLQPDEPATRSDAFTLDGLFHLVGALGAGKSTLIWVMTYLLAQKGYHLTVVFATVVETFRFAAWLRRLGVRATPALGTSNRADHAQKVGWANTNELSAARIFSEAPSQSPILDWIPAPCALSGATTNAIPVGKEPCNRLIGERDNITYRCPLLNACPVHQMRRDLLDSQVWVANPMSLLYSAAPEGLPAHPMRLLEAIYRVSDVVIIDEADRVQVLWDRAFAPTAALTGSDRALLDKLHTTLAQASVGRMGRQRAAEAAFNRLTRSDGQAHNLANHAFRLIAKSRQNAKWVSEKHLTNPGMFRELAANLSMLVPAERRKDAEDNLLAQFKAFWLNPLSREGNELVAWINRLLGSDANEKRLQRTLETWLSNQLALSPLALRNKKTRVRLLELCLTISALLKRINDIEHLLPYLELSSDKGSATNWDVPEEITRLVPDSPLGLILGTRLIGYQERGSLGVFTAFRHRGLGRWLLLNLPSLFADMTEAVGPHVVLTSATSWFPGATQFHLAVPPHAVLLGKEGAPPPKIEVSFRPVHGKTQTPIPVSGAAKRREANLRQIVRELGMDGKNAPSVLQAELDSWDQNGELRRILLVVNSYEQSEWVLDELARLPQWAHRVVRLLPDEQEIMTDLTLRTREVERFKERDADILIAPLLAIQRGFNILDNLNGALLGSVFFLVRPYPPPDDLTPQILSLNAWTMDQLAQAQGRVLSDAFTGISAVREFRKRANREWHKHLSTAQYGINSMSPLFYDEFLRNQFIVIWQTIGRLLRGGRDARVFFVDGAFSSSQGKRRMMLDWCTMLDKLMQTNDLQVTFIAEALYKPIWDAFKTAQRKRTIY